MLKGKPIVTRIAGKYQVTVPPEIRDIFNLREGDLFQWNFDGASGELHIIPQRAQLLTPQIRLEVEKLRESRKQAAARAEPSRDKVPETA